MAGIALDVAVLVTVAVTVVLMVAANAQMVI